MYRAWCICRGYCIFKLFRSAFHTVFCGILLAIAVDFFVIRLISFPYRSDRARRAFPLYGYAVLLTFECQAWTVLPLGASFWNVFAQWSQILWNRILLENVISFLFSCHCHFHKPLFNAQTYELRCSHGILNEILWLLFTWFIVLWCKPSVKNENKCRRDHL